MGYGSHYLVLNFGTLCFLLFVTPIGWLLATFLAILNKPAFGWILKYWNNKMFFNDWIGFFSETYLFLGMCVTLNLDYFRFDTYGNSINSTLTVVFALILAAGPIFVGWFYRRYLRLAQTKLPEFLAKYGSGIEGLNFKRQGNYVLIY